LYYQGVCGLYTRYVLYTVLQYSSYKIDEIVMGLLTVQCVGCTVPFNILNVVPHKISPLLCHTTFLTVVCHMKISVSWG